MSKKFLLSRFPLVIKQHWKLSIFFIILLPILVRLGFWQLERQNEKKQELTVYQQRQELPAIPLSSLLRLQALKGSNAAELQYRNVVIKGFYEKNKYWLIDNQPRSGKTGYEVVMPLITDLGLILINRGWIVAPPRREQLPEFKTPIEPIEITGYLYPSQKNAIFSNTQSDLTVDWPKRVLQLDVNEALSQLSLEKNQLEDSRSQETLNQIAMTLRIDEASPGALVTQWPIINTRPEKHQAYAVQWFAMAFALIVLYGWFLYRSAKES